MNFTSIPSDQVIQETVEAIKKRGVEVIVVDTKAEALKKIQELIPAGSAVLNGSSTTLNEIGFTELLKSGNHSWKNLHVDILKEKDYAKQSDLRRHATADADYFLASMNAISQNGELVSADASGSRVGAFPFVAKKLLLVAGVQKIVPNLETAMQRIREHVLPLEDKRAQAAYGMHSMTAKWVIIEHEGSVGRSTLILVKEALGF